MFAYLDEKTNILIQKLLQYDHPVTISQIAKDTNLSRRIIYYHLDKINDELKQSNITPIVNQNGVLVNEHQRGLLEQLIESSDKTLYILSPEERQLYLMFHIAMNSERMTIENFIDLLKISRNTILNDIQQIRTYLATSQYHVQLISNKKDGYHFTGNDADILQFLYALINQILQTKNKPFLNEMLNTFTTDKDSKILLSKEFRDTMYASLQRQTVDLSKTFVEKDLHHAINVFPYFILALRKWPHANLEDQLQEVVDRIEFPIAAKIIYELSETFYLDFTVTDLYFATLMLLSIRKNYDGHNESPVYHKLYQDIMDFITAFEQETHVQLDDKKQICERLMTHFKALQYRKKYNVFSYNPLTSVIKIQYKHLFSSIKKCIQILAEKMAIQFSDDDIAYIAIHFGGVLKNQHKQLSKNRIVIITDEGQAIQNLIVEQCERYLSRVEIVSVISRLEDLSPKLKFDFAVTTLTNITLKQPVVVVNPIFQYNDILNILKYSQDNPITPHHLKEDISQLLHTYPLSDDDRETLTQSILKIIDDSLALSRTN